MDARELRIDNLVGYEHDIVKVVDTSEEYTTIIYNDGYVDEVKTDQLYPINLTDEILEKSGWEKEYNTWYYRDENLAMTFTLNSYGDDNAEMMLGIVYNCVDNNILAIADIKSVHELQNAMWGLKAKCEIDL